MNLRTMEIRRILRHLTATRSQKGMMNTAVIPALTVDRATPATPASGRRLADGDPHPAEETEADTTDVDPGIAADLGAPLSSPLLPRSMMDVWTSGHSTSSSRMALPTSNMDM